MHSDSRFPGYRQPIAKTIRGAKDGRKFSIRPIRIIGKEIFRRRPIGYQQLIRTDHGAPRIQYNLGNAWFRMNQAGRAILAYERAHMAMPRDADLNFNLAHARDQVVDAIPPSRGFFSTAFFWLPTVSQSELFWCFAILNLLLCAALLIRLFHRSEWLFYSLLLVLCLWLVTGLSLGMKWAQVHDDHRAVILQKEVEVLAGPHEGDTVLFKLHEGAIVEQERSEGKVAPHSTAGQETGLAA